MLKTKDVPTIEQTLVTNSVSACHWPGDIGEAYARYPGPYRVKDVIVLLEEEPLELYNGWLVWQDMTDPEERRIAANMQVILDLAARACGFGQAYPDQLECLLLNGDMVKPDVCLVSDQRFTAQVLPVTVTAAGKGKHYVLKSGPELAIEIRSPSNRRTKERIKRKKYFENGTLLVWDVDPKKHKIWVYSAENQEESQEYSGNAEISCEPLLPGWRRPVADFFAKELSVEQIVGQVVADWRAESEAKGEIKGEARGEAKGEARGEVKALRAVLLRLARRFEAPSLSVELEERLGRYNVEQLTALVDNIAVSNSLTEWLTTFPD